MKGFDIPVRSSSPKERYPFERITLIFSLLQRKKKQILAWTGFEPMTSAIPVQQSTSGAGKPTGSCSSGSSHT